MRHFAVAAIGRDRPGIVTAVTRSLLERELNVEDSQMTILRGHFTMMLIIAGDDSIDVPDLRASLDATARELGLEAVSLSEVTDVEAGPATEPTHIVTVYGADHPGIVHAVAAALSDCGVNITDLNTRLVGEDETDDLYAMMLEIALPEGVSVGGLEALLEATKREQGVEITIRELDQDAL
ncbi:MAG: glycine cleavage system transcriptional repressor [Solirubrobacteraceae bacterium]|jgi:glycine cleavage system transcriptional repressor|nr:glycine cleavage system transcriptional repressor [Solirubrobacteraceae bacterium]